MPHPTRMSAADTGLLVIDVQDKLLAKMPQAESLVRNVAFLIDGARPLGVPVQATEQYPKGLGPTTAVLAERIPERPSKVAFSCCAVPSILDNFQRQGRPKVLLAGMETHVCVLQTALDLLAQGVQVYVAVDAVSSRFALDHEYGLHRMERAGATLVTSEMAVFEWVGGSDHPQFKTISKLIQERMQTVPK